MTYKLRRIGTKGAPYLEVLEKQVKKIGIDLDEIVKSELSYIGTYIIIVKINFNISLTFILIVIAKSIINGIINI